jgi:hypothetical protein
MLYAILRVARLKTDADVDNATRHGRRIDGGTHYDPSRTALNRHWLGAMRVAESVDWGRAIEEAVRDQHLHVRANGAVAAELLLAASPEFFIGEDGEIDTEKLDRWVEANLAWLLRRFPGMVLVVRLDLDEASPHLAVLLLPIYEKTTRHTTARAVSYRKIFCGADKIETSAKMVALQDDYATAMAPLGLQRGLPKAITGREHLTHQQYVARRIREDEERRDALAEAEAAAERAAEHQRQALEAGRRAWVAEERAARRLCEAEASVRAAEARLQQAQAMIEAERAKLDTLEQVLARVAIDYPDRFGPAMVDAGLQSIRKVRAGTVDRAERVAAFATAQPQAAVESTDVVAEVEPWRPGF